MLLQTAFHTIPRNYIVINTATKSTHKHVMLIYQAKIPQVHVNSVAAY